MNNLQQRVNQLIFEKYPQYHLQFGNNEHKMGDFARQDLRPALQGNLWTVGYDPRSSDLTVKTELELYFHRDGEAGNVDDTLRLSYAHLHVGRHRPFILLPPSSRVPRKPVISLYEVAFHSAEAKIPLSQVLYIHHKTDVPPAVPKNRPTIIFVREPRSVLLSAIPGFDEHYGRR
ncbi:MAG TPA: hypothetical protein VJB66_03570 [Candidatus Nanoarchaeia archaeon]|nr:hypothetical protein [Candidatus Nanoarchaeia archaeon]